MRLDWDDLPDDLQVMLAREALTRAGAIIAVQAEVLAEEIEQGNIADRGGADALRLLAAILHNFSTDPLPAVGMAEPAPPFG
jgi:hypothetical protein